MKNLFKTSEQKSSNTEKTPKLMIACISSLALLGMVFWWFLYYWNGISYLYHSQYVVNCIFSFFGITIPVFLILATVIIMLFKGKKILSIICAVLLIASVPVAGVGSLLGFAYYILLGPNGCSYTEDITNYGKYDNEYEIAYFPESITDDMTVVKYTYFHKYLDTNNTDIYLEVRFDNKEKMDEYLTAAKSSQPEDDVMIFPNPYDRQYTDIINKIYPWNSKDEHFASYIRFKGNGDRKYVDMNYSSITYSYEHLTIIYNYTFVEDDIKMGNDPDKGYYYPEFLKRFGVEWDPYNNISRY